MLNFEEISDLYAHEKLSYCNTQYPTILVSGLGFHDQNKVVSYWGGIPNYLKRHGADVYTARQQAFLSIPDNAVRLKYRVLDILELTKKDKINIIGHSKGGLEARYMTGKLGMHDYVASITTLGTPHRGTHLADMVLGKIPIPKFVLSQVTNLYAKIMGDEHPDSFRAILQLSTGLMKIFNEEVTDSRNIYYQSYASHISRDYPSYIWRTLAGIIKPYEGQNDGLVGVESAKWGDYKGIIRTAEATSTSHGDMIGLAQTFGNNKFHAGAFIATILHGLKTRGL
jgi:triacylglycerol lipase